ncbi:phage tail tape measure protein [Aliihoeflea sp. 2WW]|uniref:phage tail tape measure protein n=1 Tax=Aliihoeflea sp. 2WW TaxID=1381123 RepID=UPI0004658520|nr:phage tail tape measure protein [Aliihoeflea sp. 2WW]
MDETFTVSIEADTAPFAAALSNLEKLSSRFGDQLGGALRAATVSGRSLDDILRRIGLNLAGMALSQGLKPLSGLASSALSGLLGGIVPFAKGGVPGSITPFAQGGVVSGPTLFPMARGAGLMGEAGAEAILPLQRSADGRLGVAASGGGAVNVVFNVTAADANSFRKSEAQITGMLARAVSRGTRTL